MIKNLNKRERLLFGVTVALIAASLVYWIFYIPVKNSLEAQNRSLNKEILQLKKFRTIIASEKEIREAYARKIHHMQSNQSEKEETALLLTKIDTIAKKSNIHLNSIKPLAPSKEEFYTTTKVDIHIETNMASLLTFIYNLSDSDLAIHIEKLKITASGVNKNTVSCSIIVSRLLIT